MTASYEPIPGYKANVRNTDNQILGVVSDRYQIVQNGEAFIFTDALLGEGVKYETAGALHGGRRVWILAKLQDDPIKPAIILGLFYGLRRSEALGLRWRDIDFQAGTIRICNTVVKMKTRVEAEQTKSRASKRTLYIIPETKEYLLCLKKAQDERRELLGNAYHDSDNVCVWGDGRPFSTDYITQRFPRILDKYGLPKIRYHELRHTAGSLLLEKGLSAKQIQEYLGHEKVSTTLDIYGHLSAEGKKEAAVTIGGLLVLGAKNN